MAKIINKIFLALIDFKAGHLNEWKNLCLKICSKMKILLK